MYKVSCGCLAILLVVAATTMLDSTLVQAESVPDEQSSPVELKGKVNFLDSSLGAKENQHQGSQVFAIGRRRLFSSVKTFTYGLEMIDPTMLSLVHINLCMAPPTDPYGKYQWDILQLERTQSPLASTWNTWENNLSNYICRYWSSSSIRESGMAVYHVVVKQQGKITSIVALPFTAEDSPQFLNYGKGMIAQLNGSPMLVFPHLSRVKEIHLEIGFFSHRGEN